MWVAAVVGWVLDARELYLLFGGTIVISGFGTALIGILLQIPVWLWIIILIGMIFVIFAGAGYLWDWIKKYKQREKSKADNLLRIGIQAENSDLELENTKMRNMGKALDIKNTKLKSKDLEIK